MDSQALREQIKALIVKELDLRTRQPSDIKDDEPLFGGGLGLDSLDALQLAVAIEEQLGVRIPEGEEAQRIFASVASLAEYVVQARAGS